MKPFLFLASVLFFALFSESCNPKKIPQTPQLDLPTQIYVLMTSDSEAPQLEAEFSAYELKSKARVSRSQKKFLFDFNNSLITPEELMKKITASKLVVEAEFAEKSVQN